MAEVKRQTTIKPTVIKPARGWIRLKIDEVWEYRELIWLLAWRDIAVRYKQTVAGAAWAVVQPLAMMGLASVVFRRWGHIPSEGVPYPLFAFVALLPWLYFSNAMAACAGSLIKSANILTKVYFPRLIIPIASILPPLIDFCIGFVLLLLMLCGYGIAPTWRLIFVPFLLGLTMLLSLSVGVWFSALSVRYRDLSHLVPFITQLWMFASPIVYPGDLVSWRWRQVYALNPMAAIVETFRWAILGTTSTLNFDIVIASLITILLFLFGVAYFQYIERSIADFI
jgi:lipopolysaccharide transport system permease protein